MYKGETEVILMVLNGQEALVNKVYDFICRKSLGKKCSIDIANLKHLHAALNIMRQYKVPYIQETITGRSITNTFDFTSMVQLQDSEGNINQVTISVGTDIIAIPVVGGYASAQAMGTAIHDIIQTAVLQALDSTDNLDGTVDFEYQHDIDFGEEIEFSITATYTTSAEIATLSHTFTGGTQTCEWVEPDKCITYTQAENLMEQISANL